MRRELLMASIGVAALFGLAVALQACVAFRSCERVEWHNGRLLCVQSMS